MNKKYYGNHLGIVISNSDPLKKGRLQIYVPHIYSINQEYWNPMELDAYFSFPMKNNTDNSQSLTSDILDDLKLILPWAEPALPIAAGNATGRYNARTQQATTSDSNLWQVEDEEYKIKFGPRPSQEFKRDDNSIPDAFNSQLGQVPPNPYTYEYNPPDYSNAARGLFSIPNVGAHLWVFFKEGNHMCPIYFASCAGGNDYNGIYEYDINGKKITVDYPSAYENDSMPNNSNLSDSLTFRSKTVLNSNKNTIELIDTDLREILRLTHYSGSFKEFNNLITIELASKNDQKMVMGDQYQTINGHRALFVGKNQDTFIVGDNVKHVGKKPDAEIIKNINLMYDITKEFHNYNRLFNIQRCGTLLPIGNPKQLSPYQKQVPIGTGYTICPTCGAAFFEKDQVENILADWTFYPYMTNACRGVQAIEYLMLYTNTLAYKTELATYLEPLAGIHGIKFGEKCATCSKLDPDSNIMMPTGLSPSTESGMWAEEPLKTVSVFTTIMLAAQTALAPLKASIGKGDEVININQDKIETIGLKMNDLAPFRIDPEGKLRINGLYVAPGGIYEKYSPGPLIETTDVLDLPGDYNLTVSNKYKLLVGAKGVDIKTFGPLNIMASIVNFSGEQVNITSNNEINIDGGKRLSLRAKYINFSPYEHDPIVMDSPLHVSRNVSVKGGMYVEGEVGVQHVTAPSEIQETLWMGGMGTNGFENPECMEGNVTEVTEELNKRTLYKTDCLPCQSVTLQQGLIIPTPIEDGSVAPHVHMIPPHTHLFFNIPLSLCYGKEQVRALMLDKGINSQVVVVASDPVRGFGIPGPDLSPEVAEAVNLFVSKCSSIINNEFKTLQGTMGDTNLTWFEDPAAMTANYERMTTQTESNGDMKIGQILYRLNYRISGNESERSETSMVNAFQVYGEVNLTKGDTAESNIYTIISATARDYPSTDSNQKSVSKDYGWDNNKMDDISKKIVN